LELFRIDMDPQNATSSPPPQLSWQQKFFAWSIKNKRYYFWLFRVNYSLILLFIGAVAYSYFQKDDAMNVALYPYAVNFGRIAIILLGIIILPGILGRLGVAWQATRVITYFRRQLGITVFLFALAHYLTLYNFPVFLGGVPPVIPPPLFIGVALIAFTILTLMYVTSNNWSMAKLGKWWKRLHRLIYIVLWLLVLHTGLQRISIWSVMIFVFATLEVVSLLVDFQKKRAKRLIANSE
jgi:DMSO/TMAO reductase YedYZ heme-binding membrane subunit